MVRPVCRILIPASREYAFLFVVKLLEEFGLSLMNPGNSRITTWTDDGDQLEIPAASVVRQVLSGILSSVQFWKTASEDVFVTWKESPSGCTFSVYLDGLDSTLAVALTSKFAEALLVAFRSQYGDGEVLSLVFE